VRMKIRRSGNERRIEAFNPASSLKGTLCPVPLTLTMVQFPPEPAIGSVLATIWQMLQEFFSREEGLRGERRQFADHHKRPGLDIRAAQADFL
jgi:hypothetical protein